MFKKLIFILITMNSMIAFASDQKIWETIIIPYGYNLKKDIVQNRKCVYSEVINEIKSKNYKIELTKLRIGDFITLPACPKSKKFISLKKEEESITRSSDIVEWNDMFTKKGFILSVNLVKEQYCSKIWTKQIYEFLKMNKNIKNVNEIKKNIKIKIQKCKKLELSNNNEIVEQKKDELKREIIEIDKKINSFLYGQDKSYSYFSTGISQINNKENGFLSFGIRSNLIDNNGYDLEVMALNQKYILLNTKLELKNNNLEKQSVLTLGIGNLIGLKNNQSGNSYIYGNFGYIFRPNYNFVGEFFIGSNFSSKITPNFGVSGFFRHKNTDNWKGLFIEYKGTSNPIKTNSQIILTGFKLFF